MTRIALVVAAGVLSVTAFAHPVAAADRPVNDDRVNATVLSSQLAGSQSGTTVGATGEPGESVVWDGADFCAADTTSVWYSWTAPSAGHMLFNTAMTDSSYDSTLAAYTIANDSSLTLVVQNDQWGSDNASRIAFVAAAGATYLIRVGAACDATWPFTLSWKTDDEKPFIGGPSVAVQRWTVSASWSVIDDFAVTTECRVDAGTYFPCSGTWSGDVPRGAHTFTVKATDEAGNVREQAAVFTIKPGRIRP